MKAEDVTNLILAIAFALLVFSIIHRVDVALTTHVTIPVCVVHP